MLGWVAGGKRRRWSRRLPVSVTACFFFFFLFLFFFSFFSVKTAGALAFKTFLDRSTCFSRMDGLIGHHEMLNPE